MSGASKIEWTDTTWNPITGCTKVSPGCTNCYAEKMAIRLRGQFGYPKDEPFTVVLRPERFADPLKIKKPKRIFVNSMSDLFHESVPFEFIDKVFAVMSHCSWHTFIICTKRAYRMRMYLNDPNRVDAIFKAGKEIDADFFTPSIIAFPLPNVWLLVSVENQAFASRRIPELLETQAAVRGLSIEPMLTSIDLTAVKFPDGTVVNALEWCEFDHSGTLDQRKSTGIDWVICGGESGPNARAMHPRWVESLRDQAVNAEVPFFFKQWGRWQLVDKRKYPKAVLHRSGSCQGFFYPTAKSKAGRLLDGVEWNQFPDALAFQDRK